MAGVIQSVKMAYTFADTSREKVTTTHNVNPAATTAQLDTLQAAYLAMSNATVNKYATKTVYAPSPITNPVVGTYQTVQDKVLCNILCDNGTTFVAEIPAPKSTIFDADQETLTLTNATVIAWFAAFKALATSTTAGIPVTLLSGKRMWHNSRS